MPQYRLKKDLPGIKAGAELVWDKLEIRFKSVKSSGSSVYFDTTYVVFEDWAEWFEEIPDFSFVKDGDVYADPLALQGESTGRVNCCFRGKAYRFNFYLDKEIYTACSRDEYTRGSYSSEIKPENLVYRPGPTPSDPPEVDKLGWGPMEPKKAKYTVEVGLGYEVREYLDEDSYITRASCLKKPDAELFAAALRGKDGD